MADFEDTKRDCLYQAEQIFKTTNMQAVGRMEEVDKIIEIARNLEDYIYGKPIHKPAE